MISIEEVRNRATQLFPILQEVRRHLHANPELSFQEFETSAYLQQKLKEFGIEHESGWVETGILARIEGRNHGKHVALRGDMDALPIQEASNVDYASKRQGVMHACGHDVHSTCLLGAGILLHGLKDAWVGKLSLVFQPGEEKLPGGAGKMLEAGLFSNDAPDAMLALHVFPELEAGKLGFREGMYMASTDELYFKVKGKGGHAAMPQQLKDPVYAAAQLVLALQQISSRLAPPAIPTVLSIGKVLAEGTTNVIPSEVQLEGTFRTMNEAWRTEAHQHIVRIANETGKQCGVEIEVEVRKGYPVLENDRSITQTARKAAIEMLGNASVSELDLRMTAEDFAWFAQRFPACFFRLGTRSADGRFASGVHTANFDIDEKALITGVESLSWMALKILGT
jgi:amidohydrolase